MKQVIQSYNTGKLVLSEVPAPALKQDRVLLRATHSLISVGTERCMIDLAKRSLAGKALARPDLVRRVLDKVRTEGPREAYRQTMGRLDAPVPLGYSAAGVVTAVGPGVTGFAAGDRVACAGSGIASHAEVLCVPRTLASPIPDGVPFEAASFVALGSIALHAVRLAQLAFGESAAVLGLGLLGQLAVQILASAGYRVVGMDPQAGRCRLAQTHGARATAAGPDEMVAACAQHTDGYGADAVLIFASTGSNEPIELAAELARERGRVVVPGLVGLDLPRKTFYEKELEFVVSRAWGPGMYDPSYEAGQVDYPLPYVRWTAQRNMAHFLALLDEGRVHVDRLITHRFPIERAVEAYEMILAGKEPVLGVVLQYPEQADERRTVYLQGAAAETGAQAVNCPAGSGKDLSPRDPVRIGLIGAGLFAKGTLLPALRGIEGVALRGVATSTGISGENVARKYSMAYCTTDVDEILDDREIDLVMILTRHGSHAALVCRALAAGKHVYVEKPLALNEDQLAQVVEAYHRAPGQLAVGFNRRFAPGTRFALERLARGVGPLMVAVRANVGHIPPEMWVHDPEQGGGNLVGEACHFFDLIQALTGSEPAGVYARAVRAGSEAVVPEDNLVLTMTMADGSVGTIVYTALGDKAYPRERVEAFRGGAACAIENFKTAVWSQGGRRARLGNLLSGVDRGHRAQMEALIGALRRGESFPVPFASYVATTRATLAAVESLRCGQPVGLA